MSENLTSPERPAPTVSRRSRPATLRILGIWLAVLAVLAGVGTASASAGETSRHRSAPTSLEGVWDLTVTVHAPDGPATTTPRFTFRADHQLSAEGPPEEDGAPQYEAQGFWNEKEDGTFAFYVTHPGRDDGAILGSVQAVHMGKITGTHFSSVAYAFVTTSEDGAPEGPIDVDTTATWVSPLPAS
ncbi:hypothetical protein [Streptomyces sp. NPDC048565]|uniref:hypothetical protein n=1 Tax=Streptomyces sp. NPDC048565 TaxID=3155266 RepID=UPI00343A165B